MPLSWQGKFLVQNLPRFRDAFTKFFPRESFGKTLPRARMVLDATPSLAIAKGIDPVEISCNGVPADMLRGQGIPFDRVV